MHYSQATEPLAELRGRAVFPVKRAFFRRFGLDMEPSLRYAEATKHTTCRETAPCPWESSYQTPGTVSRGTFPVPGRGGRPSRRNTPQVRGGPRPGAGRAASPLRPPRRRAPSRRPQRAGAGPPGQGGVGPPDHTGPDRPVALRPDAAGCAAGRRVSEVPGAPALSRAFAWFAETRLPERVHGALVRAAYEGSVVGHISRDSTAIVGRERPAPKPAPKERPRRRRGRPRKGEEVVREPTRPGGS